MVCCESEANALGGGWTHIKNTRLVLGVAQYFEAPKLPFSRRGDEYGVGIDVSVSRGARVVQECQRYLVAEVISWGEGLEWSQQTEIR